MTEKNELQINLEKVPSVNPHEVPTKKSIQEIGYSLAKYVFVLLAIISILVTCEIYYMDYMVIEKELSLIKETSVIALKNFAEKNSEENFKIVLDTITKVDDINKQSRIYFMDYAKFIINLLIPIFTAILGYIFGTNREKSS